MKKEKYEKRVNAYIEIKLKKEKLKSEFEASSQFVFARIQFRMQEEKKGKETSTKMRC